MIEFDKESDSSSETCPVMEQKETVDGLKDEHCGREVPHGHAGLCE